MGDMGDSFREHREHQKKVKREREERNTRTLRRLAAEDAKLSVSDAGDFYLVSYAGKGAKFWPSTGSTILQFGRDQRTMSFTATQLVDFLKGKAK